jgi:hypothetical protein
MKKLFVISITLLSFTCVGQFKHDVQLPQNKKFKKIGYWSIIDSLNQNQNGKVQLEWAEFHVSLTEMTNIDSFMGTVDNVNDVVSQFGSASSDIVISASGKHFRALSGFYYCVVIPNTISKSDLRKDPILFIAYPRTDKIQF